MAKARLGSSMFQKAKIWYGWDFNLSKMLKQGTTKVWLGSYIAENAKIR